MAKILLMTHIFPPAVDGGSRVIAKIGEYLEKHGHQILVITSNCHSSDDFVTPKHPQVSHPSSIISLPVITWLHRPFKLISKIFPSFKTIAKGPIFKFFPFLKSLISIVSFQPDYIFVGPLPTTMVIYAHFINHLLNHLFHYTTKLLINPCFHPYDPDFQTPILISILKKADYAWCLTKYEKRYLFHKLKIKYPKYFVYGLGVDSNFLISPQKIKYPPTPKLIFLANFSAHKRCELLIKAFDRLLKKFPQAQLTLLGQKTLYFPNIETYLSHISPRTRQKIKIIFNPSQNQIINILDQSSCLVLPSIHESFGLVFVESLARGKVIIGADTPQTFEVIKTLGGGLTFKTDQVQSLYLTLLKLLSSKSLSQKFGKIGYQNVKKYYTWDKIGKELCQKLSI